MSRKSNLNSAANMRSGSKSNVSTGCANCKCGKKQADGKRKSLDDILDVNYSSAKEKFKKIKVIVKLTAAGKPLSGEINALLKELLKSKKNLTWTEELLVFLIAGRPDGERAWEVLIKHYEGVLRGITNNFIHATIPSVEHDIDTVDDLMQEARMSLFRLVMNGIYIGQPNPCNANGKKPCFSPVKGRLTTYLKSWIRYDLQKYAFSSIKCVSAHYDRHISRLQKYITKSLIMSNHRPTDDEIMRDLGFSKKCLRECIEIINRENYNAWFAGIHFDDEDDSQDYLDNYADVNESSFVMITSSIIEVENRTATASSENQYFSQNISDILREQLDSLDEMQFDIAERHWVDGESIASIARSYHITQHFIRKELNEIQKYLKESLEQLI